MAEFLVIRLAADTGRNVEWIAVDDSGSRRGAPGKGSLADAAGIVGSRAVIVLVPATDVLTTVVDIPVRGGARLRAALPFALEERLADDVENLHFAAGQKRPSGQLPVSVVAHDVLRDWLAALAAAGIEPLRVVAENYGLARIPGTLSMLVAEDRIMFNDGADNEFALQDVTPAEVLSAAGVLDSPAAAESDGERPARHLLAYCGPEDEARFRHDWIALRGELDSVDLQLLPDGVLPRLATTVATGAGVNLLQGNYGARAELASLFSPWRYAAVLLLALGVLGIGGKAVDYYRLGKEEARLREQFTLEYRQLRPDDTREVLDPVGTVNSIRRSIGASAAPQVFLPSLQQLGLALQQYDVAEVEAISYRAGVVDVRLIAPDVATLDNIQKMVSASGRFRASIQSTDQVGDKVSSRIQIRESGA